MNDTDKLRPAAMAAGKRIEALYPGNTRSEAQHAHLARLYAADPDIQAWFNAMQAEERQARGGRFRSQVTSSRKPVATHCDLR